MVLIRRFPSIVITALLLISSQVVAQVTAEIDRQSIGFGETLQLIVRSDQRIINDTPDTTPLADAFDILSTSQSTRQSIINGRREISSEWLYTLAPKREGTLIIPALTLAGEKTQPLRVAVGPASQASADAAVFLKSELDQSQVYVQQQALLTIRVYHAVSLGRGANLSEPNIPDAIVKKLQDNEFQTRIDGREYRVFEQKFAIFPQRSGTLDIPPSILTATIPTRRSSRNLLDPFANNGQTIRLVTEAKVLQVLPQDTRYTGEHWLPAHNVMLLNDWNGSDNTIKLGESLTRTVTVIADGLLGAQIPPLPLPDITGLKIYPDQSVVSDGEGDKITGSFTQSYAIIATQAGSYTLPEETLSWWDVKNQQTRQAVLPAQTITVLPAAAIQANEPTAPANDQIDASANELQPEQKTAPTSNTDTSQASNLPWWLVGFMSLLTLFSSAMAWYFYRQTRHHGAVNKAACEADSTLDHSIKALMKACSEKNAQATLDALRDWSTIKTGQNNLSQALTSLSDTVLLEQVTLLQRALYQSGSVVELDNAFTTIATRVKHLHAKKKSVKGQALTPLYPKH